MHCTNILNPCPEKLANHLFVNTVTVFQPFYLWQCSSWDTLDWCAQVEAELTLNCAQPLHLQLEYKTHTSFPDEVTWDVLPFIPHRSNIPPTSSLNWELEVRERREFLTSCAVRACSPARSSILRPPICVGSVKRVKWSLKLIHLLV